MKVVAIALIIFGYTLLYAGLSRVYGDDYAGNTFLALLGFENTGKQGDLTTKLFSGGTSTPSKPSTPSTPSTPAPGTPRAL